MKKNSILLFCILFCQLSFAQLPSGKKLLEKVKNKIIKQDDRKQTTNQEQPRSSRDESGNSWNDVEILFTKPFIFTKGEIQLGYLY